MRDARIIPQEKLESMAYACEQVKQRGSNNVVEIQWRRRVLLLLAHVAALEDKLTVAEAVLKAALPSRDDVQER